jgi:quercetin dioxygenase-like cupin family protein
MDTMDTAADLHPGYAAPHCTSTGVSSSARFAPAGFSLWLVAARLEPGATIRWENPHGDEGIHVVDGALSVDGRACGPGGAVIIEADAAAEIRADAPTELVHVGPVATSAPSGGLFGPADPEGHGVHVIPAQDADAIDFGAFTQVCFTDSTCPTCRINWFRVTGVDEPYVVGSHLHSEDEIIHVLSGALQVGPRKVSAGMSIAIPGQQRYGFRTDGAFSFVNYRANASTVVTTPGSEPRLETVDSLRRALL